MKAIVILVVLVFAVFGKILVIMDNRNLLKTHTQFLKMLKNISPLEFAYSFNKEKIELREFDKFKYDHIVVMCTSQKEMDSKLKVNDIISYFDEGGNVIIIGDIDTSRSFRKLFYSFGADLDETGSILKDNFLYHGTTDFVSTRNYQVIHPFSKDRKTQDKKPLLYRGVGMDLVNYENYQLYNLVKAGATTYSRQVDNKITTRVGTEITLVGAVQGLNNARAIVAGSLDFFSNDVFDMPEYGNKEVVEDLVQWTFHRSGIVRFKNMHYHGEGAHAKETLFNVGEKISYQVQAQVFNPELGQWQPYIADDIQVEFVMLDPWIRADLQNKNGTSVYSTEFYAPTKEGIYQFKIIYRKPGYNFITQSERVTVRPFKHDEFERFIFVAYPYFSGLFSTIVGTFVFLIAYLYSGFGKPKSD